MTPCTGWLFDLYAHPDKGVVFSTIEGLISHFEVVMTNRGFETPCEEVYAATEAPNGELGFYLVGDGSQRAYRARCRPRGITLRKASSSNGCANRT